MSVDPRDLEVGDKVTFAGRVTEEVVSIDYETMDIGFNGGLVLKIYSPFWELARSTKPELPFYLCLAMLDNDGENYVLKDFRDLISPSLLLNRLRRDVKTLEEAGVEELYQ